MSAALKRLFRIQYVSDLHLEHRAKHAFPYLVTPAARYLALAGDIGQPSHSLFRPFLEYVSRNWEQAFYVAGNHEYYAGSRKSMFETQDQIKSECDRFPNIHFLHHDNPSHYLAPMNFAIVGTTLWTHIPQESVEDAKRGMNDYRMIQVHEDDGTLVPLDPNITNILHAKERARLEAQIDYWGAQGAQVCVITHHMPSFGFISQRYQGHPLSVCFASHCESLMKPHVRAWIYGHTHNCSTAVVGNTVAVVNACGYPLEIVPGFCRDAWVEFPICEPGAVIENEELVAAATGVKPHALQ